MSSMGPPTCPGGSCQLFGVFGLFVQGLIGAWCFLTLVVLWRCEQPRRTFMTWLGDISKQMIGAGWSHIMNVFVALLLGEAVTAGATDNECVWYLLGFLGDVVFSTFLSWWAIKALRPVMRERFDIVIGDYDGGASIDNDTSPSDAGCPNACASKSARHPWWMWCVQTLIWLAIMTIIKVVVSVGVYSSKDILYTSLAWCFHLAGLCHHEHAQLITSIIIIPVIGDAFQFAVQDGFLKKAVEPDPDVYVKQGTGGATREEHPLEASSSQDRCQADSGVSSYWATPGSSSNLSLLKWQTC